MHLMHRIEKTIQISTQANTCRCFGVRVWSQIIGITNTTILLNRFLCAYRIYFTQKFATPFYSKLKTEYISLQSNVQYNCFTKQTWEISNIYDQKRSGFRYILSFQCSWIFIVAMKFNVVAWTPVSEVNFHSICHITNRKNVIMRERTKESNE